jgi:hypothetical protein
VSQADAAALCREAERLSAHAKALKQAYERATWYRFAAVFFPIPFVVVLMRLDLEAWHYYLAGGGYVAMAFLLYAVDTSLSEKCDAARAAAERALRLCEQAGG